MKADNRKKAKKSFILSEKKALVDPILFISSKGSRWKRNAGL
jgi:hypothetical protein